MSVQVGDRATYRGESVIVMAKAPHLGGDRWYLRYRDGETITGWSMAVALGSDLADRTRPTWETGDSVRVGWTPYRRSGTVTAVGTFGDGRASYTVQVPQKTEETPGGTRFYHEAYDTVLGAEHIDTSA